MIRRLASLGITLSYASLSYLTRQKGSRCVVLYYHGVAKRDVERFRRQMEWLKALEEIVPLRFLVNREWSGQKVCITFDDALDCVRQNALPILRDLEIPATIFAVPGNLGREPSWRIDENHPDRHEILSTAEQLKEYPPDLIDIGGHTMTHPDLATLTGGALASELSESRQALENLLGRTVIMLSVPFGSYNQETLRAAREAGYELVVTCDPEVAYPGTSPYRVGRFKVAPSDWDLEFRLKATGAHQWRRPWQILRGHTFGSSRMSEHEPASIAKTELAE